MNQGWSGSSTVSGSTPSGRCAGEAHADGLEALAIGHVDLVAVAVALLDPRRAVDACDQRVGAKVGGVRAQAHGAAEVAAGHASLQGVAAEPLGQEADDGLGQGPNSVEPAASIPAMWRAASMTAICMPKQMPK